MDIHKLDTELSLFLQSQPSLLPIENIAKTRAFANELVRETNRGLAEVTGVVIDDVEVPCDDGSGSIRLRVYRPNFNLECKVPAMLWAHGGGMMFCSVEDFSDSIAKMAQAAQCCIVSVDYRLAPEFPYPVPLDDCYTGLRWLFDHVDELNVDRSRIAVGGVSAGGNLAAALALLNLDKEEFELCFQMLLCPMLDHRGDQHAYHRLYDKRVWNRDTNELGWQAYLRKCSSVPAYASPSLARKLNGLPPAYLSVSDQDIFVDENVEYVKLLLKAGVAVDFDVVRGGFHGFELLVPGSAIAQRTWRRHIHALKFGLSRKCEDNNVGLQQV